MNNDAQSDEKKSSELTRGMAEQFLYQEVINKVVAHAKDIAISFANKDKNMDNVTWLTNELMKYGVAEEKAVTFSNEIISTIHHFNSNFEEINKACVEGKSEKKWLSNFVNENLTTDIQQKGDYLAQVSDSLDAGNKIAEKISAQNATPEIFADFQKIAQTSLENPVNNENWNIHTVRTVTDRISQQTELMATAALAEPTDIPVVQESVPILEEILDESENGDFNLKMISAAAMKITGVADKVPFLDVLPISALTNIACVGAESVKNLINVARGKILAIEAVKKTGRATVVAVANFIKSGFPATLLTVIPSVGLPLSIRVGGYLRSLPSEKIQEKIYEGVEKVKTCAKNMVNSVKKTLNKVAEKTKNTVNKILSWFS